MRLVLLSIVFLFVFIGIVYSVEDCELSDEIDHCYLSQAFMVKDGDLCERINEIRQQEYCYREISSRTADPEFCLKIKSREDQIDCVRRVVWDTRDKAVCRKVSDQELFNVCIQEYKDTKCKFWQSRKSKQSVCTTSPHFTYILSLLILLGLAYRGKFTNLKLTSFTSYLLVLMIPILLYIPSADISFPWGNVYIGLMFYLLLCIVHPYIYKINKIIRLQEWWLSKPKRQRIGAVIGGISGIFIFGVTFAIFGGSWAGLFFLFPLLLLMETVGEIAGIIIMLYINIFFFGFIFYHLFVWEW